jgi:uncharacterized pyridoxamine 5'-phosphate oxidase family protein
MNFILNVYFISERNKPVTGMVHVKLNCIFCGVRKYNIIISLRTKSSYFKNYEHLASPMWWFIPVIQAIRRLKQRITFFRSI